MRATGRIVMSSFLFALLLTTSHVRAQENWKPGDSWKVATRDTRSTIAMGPETMDSKGCFMPKQQCLKTLYESTIVDRLSTGWTYNSHTGEPMTLYDTVVNECGHHVGVVQCFEKERQSSLTHGGQNVWAPWMGRNHVCRSGYIQPDKILKGHLAALYRPTGRVLVRFIGIDAELGRTPSNAESCMKLVSNDGAIFEQETVAFEGNVPWYPAMMGHELTRLRIVLSRIEHSYARSPP